MDVSRAPSDTSATRADVLLVSMPWAPPFEPALGLGILKSSLARASISAQVFHAAPQLLRWCSIRTYEFLANLWGVNDFLFSFPFGASLDELQRARLEQIIDREVRLGRHRDYPDHAKLGDLLERVRSQVVPEFLDDCVGRIVRHDPKLIGLTCLFDQTIASLALAERLKHVLPDTQIVFGGYALEGPPGHAVAAAFPFVDLVVAGDGEAMIVDLAEKVLSGCSIRPANNRVVRAPKYDLSQSPAPDYADWFADLDRLEADHRIKVQTEVLPIEASRGCWWGQSQHCVFCGIDEETLRYRHKPARQVLDLLTGMRDRYGDFTFRFSDYIMPKAYYDELLPPLAAQARKFKLHSEIKANHPPDRVKLLADAGFQELQPGIESFSTPVLKEMRKGVRAIDNVSLLMAGYANRITVNYNILFGLPGDTQESYLDMLAMIPDLYHLTPPASLTETVVTRFAPLQSDPVELSTRRPHRHDPCYDTIFSEEFLASTGFQLDSYCYYFERNFEYGPGMTLLYSFLQQQVEHWRNLHRTRFVELSFELDGDVVEIRDTRRASAMEYSLSPDASDIFLRCRERPFNIRRVISGSGQEAGSRWHEAVAELEARRLVWGERDLILGLATPRSVSDAHAASGWCKTWKQIYC